MLFNVENAVSVTHNLKVKPNIISHSRLPDALCLVILLRTERWVSNVGEQKTKLLLERRFYLLRELLESPLELRGTRVLHRYLRPTMNLSTLSKGPISLPSSISRSATWRP